MKLTTEQLKEMIKEEMQSMDETFGRHMSGQTHRTAQGFDAQAIQQLTAALSENFLDARDMKEKVITAGVTALLPNLVKNIQHPREGSIVQAFDSAMSAEEGMQESKKRNKK